MSLPITLKRLITAFKALPGVGNKGAQRMALHLIEHDKNAALILAKSLVDAVNDIKACERCRAMSESNICEICSDETRDRSTICVVGSPLDVIALEQAGYDGLYFVLRGNISPMDGIGPEAIGLQDLIKYLVGSNFKEVVLATNPTVEGEATAHYIAQYIAHLGLKVTRIAHGVPVGGELELIDGGTLAHALAGRRLFN